MPLVNCTGKERPTLALHLEQDQRAVKTEQHAYGS
jgi:hypothetical protein